MIYTKNAVNGIQKETPLSEVPMFCKCPECGKEVSMNPLEVQDLMRDEEFDIDDSATYCDECQEELKQNRKHIESMMSDALQRMPLDRVKQLYSFLLPYCAGEDNA